MKKLLLDLDSIVSPETREAIRIANPDTVIADEETLSVEYGKDWSEFYARTNVTEEFARRTKLEAITLPSGRQLKLVCGHHSAITFPELVVKLEQARIEREWSEARGEYESRSWISNPADVYPNLSKLLTAVEITKDSKGEAVLGFYSLYSDSSLDFQIKLRQARDEAEKETASGLTRLLRKACKEVLAIPQEEPYYTTGSWSRSINELGQALTSGLENLAQTKNEGLTAENILSRIEEVKTGAERMKADIGGNYAEVRDLIAKTEAEVDAKVEAVEYDDREYVSSEISQAEEAVSEAKNSLKKLAYEDAKTACEKAAPFVADLPALVAERTKAREEAKAVKDEVSSTLYDIYGGYDHYSDSTEDEKKRADEIGGEINSAYDSKRYDEVLKFVETARSFIAEVEARQAKQAEAYEIITKHISAAYAETPFFSTDYPEAGRWIEIYNSHPLFAVVMAKIEESGEENLPVMESRLGDSVVARVYARKYYDTEIDFQIIMEKEVFLSEDDLEKIEVATLIELPSGDEIELARLKMELARSEEEIAMAKGEVEDGYSLILEFRKGKHPKTGAEQMEAGGKQVKYIADIRGEQPEPGKRYFCRKGRALVDLPTFKLILVEPYLAADDDKNIKIKISELEKKIEGSETQTSEVVSAESLKALAERFEK